MQQLVQHVLWQLSAHDATGLSEQQIAQLTAAGCTSDDIERVRAAWDAFNRDLRKFGGGRYAAKLSQAERQSRFMATLARMLLPDEYVSLTKSVADLSALVKRQSKQIVEMDVDARYVLDYHLKMKQMLQELQNEFQDAEQQISAAISSRAQSTMSPENATLLPPSQRARDEVKNIQWTRQQNLEEHAYSPVDLRGVNCGVTLFTGGGLISNRYFNEDRVKSPLAGLCICPSHDDPVDKLSTIQNNLKAIHASIWASTAKFLPVAVRTAVSFGDPPALRSPSKAVAVPDRTARGKSRKPAAVYFTYIFSCPRGWKSAKGFRGVLTFDVHFQVLAHRILLIDWAYSILDIALTLHRPGNLLLPPRLDEILFVNKYGVLLAGMLSPMTSDAPVALHESVGSVLAKLLCVSRLIKVRLSSESIRHRTNMYMEPIIVQENTVVRYSIRSDNHQFTSVSISTPRRVDASNRVEHKLLPAADNEVCCFELQAISTGQTVLKLTLTDQKLSPLHVFIPVKIIQPMTDPALLPLVRFLEMSAATDSKTFSNQATHFQLQQLLDSKPGLLADPSVAGAAWESICASNALVYE